MQLILTNWDDKKGLVINQTVPLLPDIENIKKILDTIMRSSKPKGCFDGLIPAEQGNFVNYLFQIKSEWHPEGCETLMITAILDEHENPGVYKKAFQEVMNKFKKIPNIFKGLYVTSGKTDPHIGIMANEIMSITVETHDLLKKELETSKTSLANIILLGIQAVGKTALITRLITGKFDDQIRPTLAPQILKLLYEQIDFRVYDVGGQSSLRPRWTTILSKPQGVVFIIDPTHTPELQKDEANEFSRMMNYYFVDPKGKKLPTTIPVLILVNKCDLIPNYQTEIVEKLLEPKKYHINYRIGLGSALTGAGLLENFHWFAKQLKVG